MYTQAGDILIKKCDKPQNVTKLKTNILHQGLNHTHVLKGKFCIGLVGEDKYLHSKVCKAIHAEHKPIKIPEGFYKIEIVKEFDHWENESREVID
jgi:hypothetical protein